MAAAAIGWFTEPGKAGAFGSRTATFTPAPRAFSHLVRHRCGERDDVRRAATGARRLGAR